MVYVAVVRRSRSNSNGGGGLDRADLPEQVRDIEHPVFDGIPHGRPEIERDAGIVGGQPDSSPEHISARYTAEESADLDEWLGRIESNVEDAEWAVILPAIAAPSDNPTNPFDGNPYPDKRVYIGNPPEELR